MRKKKPSSDGPASEVKTFQPKHGKLFLIAREAAASCEQQLTSWEQADKSETIKHLTASATFIPRANDSATIAITFAAFAAESFMNAYAAEHLDDVLFDLVERTPTEAKWRLFPLLVVGKELAEPERRGIKALFDARNQFAHSKPRWRTFEAWERATLDKPPYLAMNEHLRALRAAVLALQALDPRVDVRWLDGGPTVMKIR